MSEEDLKKHYKNRFDNINNLKLDKAEINNNINEQKFIENIAIEANHYGNMSGKRMMFVLNVFNHQSDFVPKRYRNRTMPLEIRKGFYDTDEVTIQLPEGFSIEAKPNDITIKNKFGEYKVEYSMEAPTQILYKRTLIINDGLYDSDDYKEYRLFRQKIARNDNAKIVLVKN